MVKTDFLTVTVQTLHSFGTTPFQNPDLHLSGLLIVILQMHIRLSALLNINCSSKIRALFLNEYLFCLVKIVLLYLLT